MVIIGAGQTGGRAAQTLRAEGWTGPVVLLGAETAPPYERPPLSKDVLLGKKTLAECALFEPSFLSGNDIDFRPGRSAVSVDRDRKSVTLDDGAVVPYRKLLFATGAAPRMLPAFAGRAGDIHTLRGVDDAARLSASLAPGRRILVIGGGFIGLEVAASASARGCHVTVVEAGERLVMRSVPAEIEKLIAARHEIAGVDIRTGRQVAAVEGGDTITGVVLDDGARVACDTILVAVGVAPRVDLAVAAGLAAENGIVVDQTLKTADPDIFAAGDACSFRHDLFGHHIRLESWKNAEDQGRLAALNMLGRAERSNAVPWLWSDQYELSIQVTGLPHHGTHSVIRTPAADARLVFHLDRHGRLVGASGVGPGGAIGRSIRIAQMMIERAAHPDPQKLADPSANLKALLTAEAA